ncbi:MAG TPA: hypothetical protein ENO22_10460 [candidate division Zixibacteria bacterium]|nr:hypothetical protein [candidate division Zixibacteria bacterium]
MPIPMKAGQIMKISSALALVNCALFYLSLSCDDSGTKDVFPVGVAVGTVYDQGTMAFIDSATIRLVLEGEVDTNYVEFTDVEGHYSLALIMYNATWTVLQADKAGFLPQRKAVLLSPDGTATLDFEIRRMEE